MTAVPRYLLPLLAVATLTACAEERPAAAPPRPLPAPPPRPAITVVAADFRPVFAAVARSRTIYLASREADWGARVLMGPNVVLEASRSTLADAHVTGPAGAAPAPEQQDALGAPIDMGLSNRLLAYLSSKGSALLAPAVMRRWSSEGWCPKDTCAAMSWIERALLAARARPGTITKDAPRVDVRADELPTAALAVRRLGRTTLTAEVIAQEEPNTLVFRFRRSPADTSLCPAVSIELPVLVFEAEIVSLRDGRILSRVDEARSIAIPPQAAVEIEATVPVENPEAVALMQSYAEAARRGTWNGALPPMPYWLQSDVRCKSGEQALRRLLQQVASQAEVEQEAAAGQMVAKALDPMFTPPAGAAAEVAAPGKKKTKGK